MAKINANYHNLAKSYLFSEIAKRTQAFLRANPRVEVLKLGIGNTTEPIVPSVITNLKNAVNNLGSLKTYTGYGDEQGNTNLRQALVNWYKKRGIDLEIKEIFISDGAKTDAANISSIFSNDSVVAISDPVYPVYLDSNIISAKKIVFLKAHEGNGFIPKLPDIKVDLIYLCSPNNPTGAVATKNQLKSFVDYALKNKAIIIFDAAYSEYIQDKKLPKSIYEIKNANQCSIEIQSFSKLAGFTGVRLGWTIVPQNLQTEDSKKGDINQLWLRRQTTMFNGASNIAQAGGLAVLSPVGLKQTKRQINYYMANAKKLYQAFSWSAGFKNYYAVKACPNPHILKILKAEGMGADCSSLPELVMAERLHIVGENIMFSSNDTPVREFKKAHKLKALINLDDITHLKILEKAIGIPKVICFRYNPGPLRKHQGNVIIGKPEEAKYGMTKKQLLKSYKIMKNKGVKRFGLHTMIVSNELNLEALLETARALFDLVLEVYQKTGIKMEFINLGGGIGIPYTPEQKAVNLETLSKRIKELYTKIIIKNHLHPLKIFMECGRMITGPYGYLVTRVINEKHTYKDYLGMDACMANLMRPALYGAYHHETVLGKENAKLTHTYDVVGSLCENNDKFAINRKLPKVDIGDIIVIHDTGAHGYAMGFNYNGKLKSAELLLKENGQVKLIRRAETINDYFSTLTFPKI